VSDCHCKIGRVRLKAGGEVRLLNNRRDTNLVFRHMREFFTEALSGEAPDAYAAATIRYDKDTPGTPFYRATYFTAHDALPPAITCKYAAQLILEEAVIAKSESRVMRRFGEESGWNPKDDDPDWSA